MSEENSSSASQATVARPEKRIEDLLAVLKVSRQLAASTDLEKLLKTIEESALKVLDCERATVFLHDEGTDELYSQVGTGIEEIRFSSKLGIAGQSFRTATAINILDAYADPRFNPAIDKKTGFRTRNLLTFPLLGLEDTPIGVLQVLNKRGGPFTNWDVSLVHNYGAQAGVALQRQMLLDEFAEKQRLERDLDLAREIQNGILPQSAPEVPGFELVGWSRPANETGGDFYDFVTLPSGKIFCSIGDVTGHGIGPALVASMAHAILRTLLSVTEDLHFIVSRINQLLAADLPSDRWVTAFFGILDPKEGTLTYQSAGQGPLLLMRAESGRCEKLARQGPPLGIDTEVVFDATPVVTFGTGDLLVLCTDGFGEWANAEDVSFGTDRMIETCERHRTESASTILEKLLHAVEDFAGKTPQLDDLTAVILKRTS